MAIPPDVAARDLLRHVDPKDIEDRLYDAIKLNKPIADELLATVDIPLKIGTDSAGNKYVLCDYNRDADSYRSPYTNTYEPPIPKPTLPSEFLRQMEVMANRGFQAYLRQYFDYGVCSVYCWECDDNSFGVGVFIRKDIEARGQGPNALDGSISCTDVCQVVATDATRRNFCYSLVSSALVTVRWGCRMGRYVHLSGTVSENSVVENAASGTLDHLVTIGEIIEENAGKFVERIRGIYVSKMREILSYLKEDTENKVSQKAQDLLADGLKRG
jgi:capping protein beta